MTVLLDTGPLGLVTNPNMSPEALACTQWLQALLDSGVHVYVPDIADYEVRRELLRGRKTKGIRRLDDLRKAVMWVPIYTETLMLAAELWADLRNRGLPTADPKAIDGDVILAAQAILLQPHEDTQVVIATTNVGHLARMARADLWRNITG